MLLNITLGSVAACYSLTNAIALEAFVNIANDFQLVAHGEVQLSEDLLLPPNLSGPRPGIKLVLLSRIEHLDPMEMEINPVEPILLVHLFDSLVDPLNGIQPVFKVWPGDPLFQARGICRNIQRT